eukprot:TRINITY_DN223_c0_g3_i1.p1 TRINITY_DN223_c0_g3~~TRINITY_DN223_c0_g3_i1.p1  ORF type:complete len:148 (-),score=45.32 TRINITY_DN223_c0_g3_i1:37-480(-)
MGKGGKGKGSSGGMWVYVPTKSVGSFQKFSGGKTYKGGGGKSGGGKGKNIGMVRRTAKSAPEKCAWIGGLSERDTRKDADLNRALQEWINKQASGCKFVDIGKFGSGGAIFGSEEEATLAISTLNGKKFKGFTLQFDVFVKGWKAEE